jgi:hypothetical protein
VGAARGDDQALPAADTLIKLIAVCDEMLADPIWLSDHPDEWAGQLRDLRARLHVKLEKHAERYAPDRPGARD